MVNSFLFSDETRFPVGDSTEQYFACPLPRLQFMAGLVRLLARRLCLFRVTMRHEACCLCYLSADRALWQTSTTPDMSNFASLGYCAIYEKPQR